jgi:tetratricopeptide (TPR) repeat protein
MLAGITVAVFSSTLTADLVYDARLQILTDPFLHDPWNWLDVLTFRVLGLDVLDFNRPVHLASLMLDAAVWGRNPFGYHLTSILLHAANVVLVWLVVRALLGAAAGDRPPPHPMVAIVAALFFAVHPIVTEAVCEPSFREDLLAATFALGAVALAARHVPELGGDVRRGLGCATYCLLAVASKESGIAAPFVLAAWRWLVQRRDPPARDSGFWRLAIGGGLAAMVAFLAARFLLEPSPSRIFESRPEYPGGSLVEAVKLQPRILALYAQLVVCPVNLCADYGGYSIRHLPLGPAVVILAGLAAAGGLAAWRDRRVGFGLALLLLPLLPVSNLVPIYRAAADRYLYLPLAGVACIVACMLDSRWVRSRERRQQAALLVSLAAVGLLGMGSLGRQRVWRSQLDLWTDTHARNPGSFNGANGLAMALREAGRADEAVEMARRAVTLSSGKRGDAWMTLALVYDAAGRTAEADEAAAKALDLDPRLADPDARVAALAMERDEADAVKAILARSP